MMSGAKYLSTSRLSSIVRGTVCIDTVVVAELGYLIDDHRYIDGQTGRRSDTAHHYVYNQDANSNLTVQDRHRVVRVILE